ncbi:proteoglycan 4 isoform X2 [Chelonus insularis]|uniref:proteoglycan 4 isoform X2 n=1 Tax=Chelonus insularis TaxID=460826 RepID=UPI00158A28E6|nr:proteoglycan 4 isoform X2 [Chelonus insularis]
MSGFAWVTLATNDSYCLGALVLAHSLKRVETKHDIAVLITPGVTTPMREKLSSVFNLVKEVNVLDSQDETNLALLARPELGITFTKLHCWRLTEYEKCVFVDADTLVIRNCDELFDREELSAAPDVGWPDCFNSGVFVFKPSQQTFASLTSFAAARGSFDGGDQGLLNLFFSDWAHKDISKHLPFIYNMCSTASYSYLPAYKQFGGDVKIIHFIGNSKPWLQYFDTQSGQVHPTSELGHLQSLLQHWWDIFCENVHPQLSSAMAGIAGALSKLILGEPRSPEQMIYEDHVRKQSWEQGQIDYMGRDSFDNIWKKICTTLSTTPEEKPQLKEKALPESEEEKVPSSDVPKVPLKAVPDSSDTTTEDKSAIEAKLQDAITDSHSKQTDKNISDVVSVSSAIPSGELKQFPERKIQEAAFSSTPTSPLSPETCERKTEPILALKSPPPQLCIKEFGEKMTSEVKESAEIREKSKEEENKSASVTPLSCPMSKPKTPVEESTIESPVPIQVAESVLEADIKESVSEDVKPVREEAISSTSASVQETISAVVQTPLEPLAMLSQSIAVPPPQPNGSALDIDPNFAMKKEPLRAQVPSESIVTSTSPVSESRSAPSLQDTPTTRQETKKETKVDDVPDVPKVCRKQSSVASTTDIGPTKVPEPVLQESNKLTNKESPKVQLKEIKSDESSTSEASKPDDSAIKVTEQPAEETKPNVPTASEKTEPACPRKPQDPAKPTRSKELKIPGTPIVTEATPPTSPPIEAGASLTEEPKPVKKVTKKVTKKGSEDKPEKSEGEEGKKGAKKVVKKVMKKPKDGEEEAESSVTGEKPKKVVKTVKKTTKLPSQTLEADASVPDTPPPTTSDTPVPPKRKVKSTTTKTSKKSESES